MSKHGESFDLPQMTDHDAMEDIAVEDLNENGSVQDGEDSVDGMGFEEFKDEADYVSPEEVSPETAAELKKIEQTTKLGRAIYGLQSILQ